MNLPNKKRSIFNLKQVTPAIKHRRFFRIMKINQNFFKIESSYLFSTVARKQREYQEAHPEADIIRPSAM